MSDKIRPPPIHQQGGGALEAAQGWKKNELLTKEPRLKNRICKMNSAHEEVFFRYIDDVAVGQTAVI